MLKHLMCACLCWGAPALAEPFPGVAILRDLAPETANPCGDLDRRLRLNAPRPGDRDLIGPASASRRGVVAAMLDQGAAALRIAEARNRDGHDVGAIMSALEAFVAARTEIDAHGPPAAGASPAAEAAWLRQLAAARAGRAEAMLLYAVALSSTPAAADAAEGFRRLAGDIAAEADRRPAIAAASAILRAEAEANAAAAHHVLAAMLGDDDPGLDEALDRALAHGVRAERLLAQTGAEARLTLARLNLAAIYAQIARRLPARDDEATAAARLIDQVGMLLDYCGLPAYAALLDRVRSRPAKH